MKMGPDTLGTTKNESGRSKHVNEVDTLGTAEIDSGRVKHEN
jgi:hypothetical protein